jgi:hypothetical protein|tara:strand:- start:4217 stop:5551 length:1335 start_codon:yes stop_codon:yes gene_type:complete
MSIDRTGLTLNLAMGNNDGAATPTVYDTSGDGLNAVAQNAQTCNSSFCIFGTSDRMLSTATGVFNSAEISIAFKFAPTWDADDGDLHYFFDTSAGSRYRVSKNTTANNNELWVFLGDTKIAEIPLATYEPYWKTNEENIMIISGSATTNRTDMYLNGVLILNQDTTAWTQADPAVLYTGTINTESSGWIDADIYYLRVWNRLLTADEIARYSADRVTRFDATDTVNLTNVDTSDATLNLNLGNNNDSSICYDSGILGYDQTETGTVTFSNTGVTFPGTDGNYLSGTGTGVFNTSNFTIAYSFTTDVAADDNQYMVLSDGTAPNRYGVHHGADGNSNVLFMVISNAPFIIIPLASYEDYWKVGEKNIFIFSGTSGDNNAWLNGNQILINEGTVWTPANPATIYTGASNAGAVAFDGEIHYVKTWQRIITANERSILEADRKINLQ